MSPHKSLSHLSKWHLHSYIGSDAKLCSHLSLFSLMPYIQSLRKDSLLIPLKVTTSHQPHHAHPVTTAYASVVSVAS